MSLTPLDFVGRWFVDADGRRVLLRGVNLGGDCKVPYPDGGTETPDDFAGHRDVSFVGRPFPIEEAEEHLARLQHWGFNCLRLLTTWEAVEHVGPGQHDEDYLDFYAEVCRRAGEHGFYVFVDFHQDMWSRMSGGDGAPGWTFEAAGIDPLRLSAADAAHVMQARYDYDDPRGRQEENYPTMSWSQNARYPANGIMWTLFFAGRTFTPDLTVDGKNIENYLQDHYLGAQRAVAGRLKGMAHVLGFDTLNEPIKGWIGSGLSERDTARPRPGLAWSPIDGLLVARGVSRRLPWRAYVPEEKGFRDVEERTVNPDGVPIWLEDGPDPFERAGAWRYDGDGHYTILDEDFFRQRSGRAVGFTADFLAPFFNRVAETVRAVEPGALVFAEMDPFEGMRGERFPATTPRRTVNASHWYDIRTLGTKRFAWDVAVDDEGHAGDGREALVERYAGELRAIAQLGDDMPGGPVPTLIGEFGIPFDLDGGAAYDAFAGGDHSLRPWRTHIAALSCMYDALDRLMLNSTQWNYTATNRNDLRIGDRWNQEDLSIFSRDQQRDPDDPDSGGRALAGYVRPYARRIAGEPVSMAFDRAAGVFTLVFRPDPEAGAPTEIFVPMLQFPNGYEIEAAGLTLKSQPDAQIVLLEASGPAAEARVVVRRR